jgi:hypothetical protein
VLVTTIPSNHALGRTFFAEEPRPVFTRAQLLGRAARALAGRAAEEVVFGVLTSGAVHDLEVAERIALELLRTGMSEKDDARGARRVRGDDGQRAGRRLARRTHAQGSRRAPAEKPMRCRSRSCATRSARCASRPSG